MPAMDQKIPLTYLAWDASEVLHVRATLIDSDKATVSGSPVTLSHAGGGLYCDNSIPMPMKDFVLAKYEPFCDAGFTKPSSKHLVGEDRFELLTVSESLLESIVQLRDLLNQVINTARADSFAKVIQDDEIRVKAEDDQVIQVKATEDPGHSIQIEDDDAEKIVVQSDEAVKIDAGDC